jgi:D-tyrosyl-tRNA(Tyr) deacylase
MRAVVQRVSEASVTIDGKVVGQIAAGLCVLVGVAQGDAVADAAWLATKVSELRIFEDEAGKMNRSVLELGGAILAISQFTLLGDAQKGRRPSFIAAARPEEAQPLYAKFCEEGVFRATMQVRIVNEGPVTMILDSRLASRAAPPDGAT